MADVAGASRARCIARFRLGAAAAGLALLVGACGGTGVPSATSPAGQFLRGTAQEPRSIDTSRLRAPTPCPPVSILPDTQSLRVTTGGNDLEEGTLRWQARIDRTARECEPLEDGFRVRVGIAGRALSGPEGAPGTVTLPIRVVVREGGEVTYSKLHTTQVSLTAGAPTASFAIVDEEVRISGQGARILVGFDDRARR